MAIALNDGNTSFVDKDLSSEVLLLSFTATLEYVVGVRVDLGEGSNALDSSSSDITIKAKVTQTDGEVVEAYSKTISKEEGDTQITHNFDKTLYLQEGEVLGIYAQSSNTSSDVLINGNVYILGVRTAGGSLTLSMERTDILNWLKAEFAPLTLATPDGTINQIVANAIRYWNTHSGYKISQMYDYTPGSTKRIQLDESFKDVVDVIPHYTTTWIWNDHPLWTLLGITVLDNVTTDLILMSEAFRSYRKYVGTDMRWHFEKSSNPSAGGWLYIINLPQGNSKIYVVGTRRITSTETIQDEYILDWILYYSKALLQITEGNTLRKSDIVNIKNDGQELVNEGITERDRLQEKLFEEGRWVALANRA